MGGLAASASAEGSLHGRIDAMIAEANVVGQAPIAGDADYLRRTYLALHGLIPTSAQARAFFGDPTPDKRAKLVDALLADPQFAKWMAVRFDVMLMERRGEAHTKSAPWREWLEESFLQNKPWDVLVREILSADSVDEKNRPVARWLLERQADPNALAKEASRIFLGRDISCAQCHDHPRIDDYVQRDYAGLQAFFNRTYLFQPDAAKPGQVGEQAAGEVTYLSVFTKVGGGTKPRLPGEAELTEPTPGEWTLPPNEKDKNVFPIPKHSRRAMLATALGDGHHPAFRRNIANRIWSLVLGRGLVEPLDLLHSRNPPSNPALLDLLTEQIAVMKFDMRAFIRELALTEAFQRSLDLPELSLETARVAAEKLPPLEQQAIALAATTAAVEVETIDARQATIALQRAAEPAQAEQTKLATTAAEAKKIADAAAAEQQKAAEMLASKRAAQLALAEVVTKANEALAKVGDSPELAAAAKTFQTKADALAGEIPALEQGVTAKIADMDAKAQSLATAQQNAAEAEAKLAEATKATVSQQTVFETSAARREMERVKARNAAALAERVKATAGYANALAAEKAAREASSLADQALATTKQTLERLTAEIGAAPGQIAALEAAAAASQAELAQAQEAMTAKIPAAAALTEAATTAAEACAKFPDDAELKNAANVVKTQADAAAAEVASLQKTAAEAQTKSETMPKQLADAKASLAKAQTDLAATQPLISALEATSAAAHTKLNEAITPAAEVRENLASAWARSFAAAELIPLSPEQLCWSVVRATGILDVVRESATKEYDTKNVVTDAEKADPARQAARAAGIEKSFRDQFRAHEDQFARSFGGAAGQPQTDFFATPEQALYFENGGTVRGWTGILAGRAAALPDTRSAAEEIYLSILTRLPADSEIAELTATLAARPPEKKTDALTDYAWALLTSTEFRFQH